MGCFAENLVDIPYRDTARRPSLDRGEFTWSPSVPEGVAQIFNLLYRRFLICKPVDNRDRTFAGVPSLPEGVAQIFNLLYRRFLICKPVDNRDRTFAGVPGLPEGVSPHRSPNIAAHA